MPIVLSGVTYYQMADAIYASNLPVGMDAYLGYVDGTWPDFASIVTRFPAVPVFGLTVFGNPWTGDGTDVEPGDATIGQGVATMLGELSRGVSRPIGYCPASWAAALVDGYTAAGVARTSYRLLTAHYTDQHICGPGTCGYGPGSDGTQWMRGGLYDLSILAPNFLDAAPYPVPPSTPPNVPPPAPPTYLPGVNKMLVHANVPTDPHGNGYTDVAIPPGYVPVTVSVLDAAPGTPAPQPDGERYDQATAELTIGATVGNQRVQVINGSPNAVYGITVEFEAS